MSRDIYVQDIPAGTRHVRDIPDDFMPEPLALTHDEIIETVCRVVPTADFSDPEWGLIDGEGYSIEVNIRRRTPMKSFAFHCSAVGQEADVVVARILDALELRAFDPDNETGLFQDPAQGANGPTG